MHRPLLTKTTSSRRTSQVTRRKKLHSLIAGLLPAFPILARRIAFPLLLLAAGLMLVQPCAGKSGTWTETGNLTTARSDHTATLLPDGKVLVAGGLQTSALSRARNSTIRRPAPGRRPAASPPHAIFTRRHCCPTARCSSQAVSLDFALASAELYDPASGTWTATGSLATARSESHGDIAA